MKTILVILTSLTLVQAQKPLEFSDVILLDSTITAEQLFSRANLWFAENFRSAEAVIQMSDKEAGILMGKTLFFLDVETSMIKLYDNGQINVNIKVSVKDGKYKYEFTDFYHEKGDYPKSMGVITEQSNFPENVPAWNGLNDKMKQAAWDEARRSSKMFSETMIASLKNHMAQVKQTSDW